MQFLKNAEYKKKYEPMISKILNLKKIRTQNFKNTKYHENTNSKMNQGTKPMFILKNKNQVAK